MSDEKKDVVTAYKELLDIPEQKQTLPGSEKAMNPLAKHTELEYWDNDGKPYLREYVGSEKLKGKSAIITGGDSGIGRAVALQFAREGADVTITYLPEEKEDAEDVQKGVQKEGRQCQIIGVDLMKHADCEKVVKQHVEKYGGLNILVNNASKQIMVKDIADIDLDKVESTFQSNIIAMIAMAKYSVPHMKRGSSIINNSSVTAFKGSPAMIDYSSTKGAIVTFTRSLALQLAPKGIRVNSVAEGPVFTPLQPASRPGEQMEDWEVGSLPLHGRAIQPAEIGPSFVYLASADSNVVTGIILHVNGGQWIG